LFVPRPVFDDAHNIARGPTGRDHPLFFIIELKAKLPQLFHLDLEVLCRDWLMINDAPTFGLLFGIKRMRGQKYPPTQ